jgi:O-antigen/teichoic acid export membrane protein
MDNKFFRDALWVGATNIILQLKPLILIPLLSKKFGAIGYGAWAQVVVLVAVLSPLLGLGIVQGYGRYMPAESKEEQARSLWSLVWFHTGTVALCAGALWALAGPLAEFLLGSADDYRLVSVCGLVIYADLLLEDAKAFFRTGRNARALNSVSVIQGFGSLGVVYSVYLLGGGVLEIIASSAVFILLLAVLCLVGIGWRYGAGRPRIETISRFIAFGWVLLPSGYSMWALNLADRLFLAHFRTLADIGIYSVAYSLGYFPIRIIFQPIFIFYPPTATKSWENGEYAEIQKIFRTSIKFAVALIVLLIALMATFYKPLMLLLTTKEFLTGPWLAVLVCLGYTFNLIGSYGAVVLGLAMKQKLVTFTYLSAALTNICLNWILIPPYGIYGAAIATCLSFGFQCILELALSSRYLRLSLPYGFIARCCLAAGTLILAGSHINPDALNGLPGLLICGLLFCGLYLFVLLVIGAYTVSDVRQGLKRINLWA